MQSCRAAGPQPEFRIQLFYDSLTDLQQALEAARSQPPRAELGSLVAAAPALELEEVLTPVPPGPPPNYVSRVVYEYAPGKLHELRALLQELVQRRTAAGGRANLTVRVSGGAPALSIAGFYQDLGALEATRAQAPSGCSVSPRSWLAPPRCPTSTGLWPGLRKPAQHSAPVARITVRAVGKRW